MSDYDNINYDPDAEDGGDFDNGDGDDGYAKGGDGDDYGDLGDFGDDDGGLIAGGDDDDALLEGDGDIEMELTPEDKLDNLWRDAKELKGEEKLKALDEILKEEKNIMDGQYTNYGFKSVKHIMIVSYQLGKTDKIIEWFKRWVNDYKTHMKEHLQSVNKLLDKIIEYPELPTLITLAFQNVTDKLNRTKLLLLKGKSLLKRDDPSLNQQVIDALEEAHKYLKTPEGNDDNNNVNLLLELYSLKITLAERRRNNKDLKTYFDRALLLTESGMVSNAVLGTIFTCGGRARMRESKFADASSYFFEAVKNWDSCRRQQETEDCIKLKVFSSLLSGSKVNPFDDQVTASYLVKPQIKAYERIAKDVLTKNADSFLQNIKPLQKEEIIKDYLPLLKRLIQKELFLEVVRPYSNVSLNFVGKRIHTNSEETENILVELILNHQIEGTIDQATGTLYLKTTSPSYSAFYGSLNSVSGAVDRVQRHILQGLS